MKNTAPVAAKWRTPGVLFRQQIEAALAAGEPADSLELRLTRADVSHLKRDKSVAVSEISFEDGMMWFLGVRVEPATETVSRLARPADEPAQLPIVEPESKPAKKVAARKTKPKVKAAEAE